MLRISLIGLSHLLNLFPTRFSYLLGDLVGLFWYYVLRIRRTVVRENIEIAFGNTLTKAQQEALARRNFCHYGRLIFETLSSITWTIEDFRERVELHGLEHAQKCLQEGRGAFFLTAHVGPFEFLPSVGLAHGLPLDIVVKHARNRTVEKFLQWYRTRLGARVLLESGTVREIFQALSDNHFVGFVQDQFMGPPIGLPLTFFGKLAGTGVSLALLTEKKPVPILPVCAYRDAQYRLHVTIEARIEFSSLLSDKANDKEQRLFEKSQIFNDVLENMVKNHPEQWFWLHRRWKPYRGVPRWKLKAAASLSVLMFFLVGVMATPALGVSPTGIEVPPDTKISVPEIVRPPGESDEEEANEAPNTPAPEAVAPQKSEKVSKKSRKRKKGQKQLASEKIETKPAPIAEAKLKIPGQPAEKIPFEVGERMEIQLSWIGLSAGTAVMEVRQGPVIEGRKTFQLWGNILSSKLVDAIYHIDNTVESFVDATALVPYKFLLHMSESAQLKETKVTFDHPIQKAHYWSQRISKKWGNETQNRDDNLVPASEDMFSALYFARTLDYSLNKKVTFPVYENGKNWQVEVLPVASELMTTPVGVFQCWKLLVVARIENVLKPTGDVFMWISSDSKRYIVKFDAKLKIGSLFGNLTAVRDRQ